jgi:hypothetical protein
MTDVSNIRKNVLRESYGSHVSNTDSLVNGGRGQPCLNSPDCLEYNRPNFPQ